MIPASDILTLQKELRLKTLALYYQAHAGHIGCSLSCMDLLIAGLIFTKRPHDTFILSKGHAAAALYICLNHLGEIPDEELKSFYKNGTSLPAHPAANKYKSIPFALGSLGHGFPIAAGIAKGNKLLGENIHSYVLISDGETNEGTTWEAAHFSVQHRLDNLTVLIDKNGIQGFGTTRNVLGDSAAKEKWMALGFDVKTCNGHDVAEMIRILDAFRQAGNGKPKVLIAETIKGCGVSYMENKMEWHYLPVDEDLYRKAINDITEKYSA